MPSRSEATRIEKGEYANHMTAGQLAKACGVTKLTISRWEDSGRIPPHGVRSSSGWRLWSPDQVTEILRKIAPG